VPTRTAAVRPVASTAIFGTLIFLRFRVFKGPPWDPGFVFAEQGKPTQRY